MQNRRTPVIRMEKRALQFHNKLKRRDPGLTYRDSEAPPLSQMVLDSLHKLKQTPYQTEAQWNEPN